MLDIKTTWEIATSDTVATDDKWVSVESLERYEITWVSDSEKNKKEQVILLTEKELKQLKEGT